jgi:hypothetical protein
MSDVIYNWYQATINQLKLWIADIETDKEEASVRIEVLQEAIRAMELACLKLEESNAGLSRA